MLTDQLLGRADELAVVEETICSLPALPAALVVSGEPGIGKTALWREGIALARAHSFAVMSCSPIEAERKLSFAGLNDLLDGMPETALAELPPPQRRALEISLGRAEPDRPPPDQLVIGVALLGAVRTLAREGPLLVAVDDVQWLDPPSASALNFAVRRIRFEQVGFLLALRREADELRMPLGLDRAGPELRTAHLDLGPLTLGAVHRLLHLRLGTVLPRPTLATLHETSGGNPFFALELARALRCREIELAPEQPLPVPNSLMGLVRERLRHLTPDTRQVLCAAAALSRPTFEVLGSIFRSGDVASALDDAARAGVVELDRAAVVRFAHPLLASACYGEASLFQRRELHRRLAEAVSDPEERARHLALGAEAPDEMVAAVLEDAANEAAKRGAPKGAADLLELAISLTPPEHADALRRRKILAGGHHFSCGDGEQAGARLEQAAADAPPGPERARALVRLAETSREDFEARIRLCEQALVEAGRNEREGARVHDLLAYLWSAYGDSRRSLAHARSALELAERTSDSALLASALTRAAAHEYRGGRSGVAPALLERALALDPAASLLPVFWGPGVQLARILAYQGGVEEARTQFDRLLDVVTSTGDERSRLRVLGYLTELEWRTGGFDRAARHAAEAVELAEQIGLDPGVAVLYHKAMVEAHLGHVEEARAGAEQILALAEAQKAHEYEIEAGAVLGFVELSLGHIDKADRFLRPLPATKLRQGWRAPSMAPVWENAIEAMIGVGELGDARTHLAQYEKLAREYANPWALATAARCEGLLRAAQSDAAGAFAAFERARDEHLRAGSPFEEARTVLVHAVSLRRAKQRRSARDKLEQALAVFEGLGTPLWADKARAELLRVGGRRPSTGELTPTEWRIAELVAEGRSNKEVAAVLFVTPKTVETKLSRMYAKLGIHSRAELVRHLVDQRRAEQTVGSS